jgi:hypothetical protein
LVCLPVFFLPNVTLAPDEEDFVLAFAIIYILKNIIGALVTSKEALVISNSTIAPGGINNPVALVIPREKAFPLPSFKADIWPLTVEADPEAKHCILLKDPVIDCPARTRAADGNPILL